MNEIGIEPAARVARPLARTYHEYLKEISIFLNINFFHSINATLYWQTRVTVTRRKRSGRSLYTCQEVGRGNITIVQQEAGDVTTVVQRETRGRKRNSDTSTKRADEELSQDVKKMMHGADSNLGRHAPRWVMRDCSK